MTLTSVLAYIPIAALLCAAAGHIVSVDSLWSDLRDRLDDFVYLDGEAVRRGDPSTDKFWARVRPRSLLNPGQPASAFLIDSQGGHPRWLDTMKPLSRIDLAFTLVIGKAQDLLGCPLCSGWWFSLPGGAIINHHTIRMSFWLWITASFAGWGLYRMVMRWLTR